MDILRVAKAIFRARYDQPEHEAYWPDRLDELVNGPPFDSDGYCVLAQAAINAIKDSAPTCQQCGGILPFDR